MAAVPDGVQMGATGVDAHSPNRISSLTIYYLFLSVCMVQPTVSNDVITYIHKTWEQQSFKMSQHM